MYAEKRLVIESSLEFSEFCHAIDDAVRLGNPAQCDFGRVSGGIEGTTIRLTRYDPERRDHAILEGSIETHSKGVRIDCRVSRSTDAIHFFMWFGVGIPLSIVLSIAGASALLGGFQLAFNAWLGVAAIPVFALASMIVVVAMRHSLQYEYDFWLAYLATAADAHEPELLSFRHRGVA